MQRTIDGEVRRGIGVQLIFSLLLAAVGITGALVTVERAGDYLRSGNLLKLVMLVLGVFGMTGYGLWNFRRNLLWWGNLNEHPTFVCPDFGRPPQVRQALQHVMDAPGAIKVGSLLATADWLLELDRWRVQSVYLPSVVWYYQTVNEHKRFRFGIISIRRTHTLHVWSADGNPLVCGEFQEAEVNQLLALVGRQSPGAISGHSKEMEKLWYFDRGKFLQMVAHRRQNPGVEAERTSSAPPR